MGRPNVITIVAMYNLNVLAKKLLMKTFYWEF